MTIRLIYRPNGSTASKHLSLCRREITELHRGLKVIRDLLSVSWCRVFHQDIHRPFRGYYTCAVCLREYPVPWEDTKAFRVGCR